MLCDLFHMLYRVTLSPIMSWWLVLVHEILLIIILLTHMALLAICFFFLLLKLLLFFLINGALFEDPVAVIIIGRFFCSLSLKLSLSSSISLPFTYMREARMRRERPHSLFLPTKSLCGLLMKNLWLHIDYKELIMTVITVCWLQSLRKWKPLS